MGSSSETSEPRWLSFLTPQLTPCDAPLARPRSPQYYEASVVSILQDFFSESGWRIEVSEFEAVPQCSRQALDVVAIRRRKSDQHCAALPSKKDHLADRIGGQDRPLDAHVP